MPHQIGCKYCKGVSQKQLGGKNQYLAREDTDHITNHVCPKYLILKREDVTGQVRGQNADVHLQPWDDKQFELKCPNRKLWAYTDGGCIGKAENFAGAGVYKLCRRRRRGIMLSNQSWMLCGLRRRGNDKQHRSIELISQGLQQRLPISVPRL